MCERHHKVQMPTVRLETADEHVRYCRLRILQRLISENKGKKTLTRMAEVL